MDATGIATITALLHFRKPRISITENQVVVLQETQLVPLSIHHIPICITFGAFSDG